MKGWDPEEFMRGVIEEVARVSERGNASHNGSYAPADHPEVWQWRYFGRDDDTLERSYLVDKLLPETGVGLISGQWGTYKTFVALDLAAAVISDTPFAGFETARTGAVLFVALEGEGEVAIRFRAALAHRGRSGQEIEPFAWIDACPRLLDPGAGKALAAMVKQAAEKIWQDFNLPVVLVIVDTAGKAAGYAKTGDENDAVVGKQIITAMAEASRATGALFLGIDHFGKAVETGTRGSSAKESDCDVVLALLGEKSISGEVTKPRLAIRKRRSGANGIEIAFRTKVVQAGEGETTLVIKWEGQAETTAAERGEKKDSWAKSLRVLKFALMGTLAEHGQDCRPIEGGPIVRAVDYEIIRAEFYKSYPAEGDPAAKQTTRRQAFNRAVKEAQASRLIGVRDIDATTFMWFWVDQPTPHPDGPKYSSVDDGDGHDEGQGP
jgi:AAA domain